METNKIYLGDCLEVLKTITDNSVDCVVTSPPYWALRDYGVDGQLGLEPTFQEYITKLCDIFDEVKRVLKEDGTCWVNLGDTYYGSGSGTQYNPTLESSKEVYVMPYIASKIKQRSKCAVYMSKCLCCIPDRFKIEMINRGWICRNEIIWYKPNCMPSSAKDRFTVDFEKVFFFVKNKKYWFETQRDESITTWNSSRMSGKTLANQHGGKSRPDKEQQGRNKRCVWKVTTKPFKEAHFATYPEQLIEPMIKAGCPEDGIVLDPFMGAGTTALVAIKQNKRYIGIELNQEYIKIAENRLENVPKKLISQK